MLKHTSFASARPTATARLGVGLGLGLIAGRTHITHINRIAPVTRILPIAGRIRIAIACVIGIACLLSLAAGAAIGAPRYADLRRLEPIQGDAVAGAQKATVCLACHGANGVSAAPTFPRLAGQRADYLYHRLVSFKSADAKDPYYSKSPMTSIAATLNDGDMRNLAAYFAAQAPQAADVATAAAEAEKGGSLFQGGDPAHGIPPCQGCHGAEAGGSSVRSRQYAAYPSLRGQYAPYVIARLSSFRDGLPHDTTNDFIMGGVARTLDDESIQAIAAWLSSLTPAKSL